MDHDTCSPPAELLAVIRGGMSGAFSRESEAGADQEKALALRWPARWPGSRFTKPSKPKLLHCPREQAREQLRIPPQTPLTGDSPRHMLPS
jgi:hypothetical protein